MFPTPVFPSNLGVRYPDGEPQAYFKEPLAAYQFFKVAVAHIRIGYGHAHRFTLDDPKLKTDYMNKRQFRDIPPGRTKDLWSLRLELLNRILTGQFSGIETVFPLPSCAAILDKREVCECDYNRRRRLNHLRASLKKILR